MAILTPFNIYWDAVHAERLNLGYNETQWDILHQKLTLGL